MFLLCVDAYSKYPEIVCMDKTSASATITVVRNIFASHGLPYQVVTDNGPQFNFQDFENFLHQTGVRHILSAPYHPATNGQVERMVQAFKQSMKSSKCGEMCQVFKNIWMNSSYDTVQHLIILPVLVLPSYCMGESSIPD